MKTIPFCLLLGAVGVWAQTPPAFSPPPSFAPSTNEALLQQALRQAMVGNSNAVINMAPRVPLTNAGTSGGGIIVPRAVPRPLPELPSNTIVVPDTATAIAPAGAARTALPGATAVPGGAIVPGGTNIPGGQIAIRPSGGGTNAPGEEVLPAGVINFPATDLPQVLKIYAELVNRTVLRPTTLPAPTITLVTQTPLTRREAIQAFDAVLALNGISMVNIGDKFVKAVPMAEAGTAGAAWNKQTSDQLADVGPYMTHVVQLKYAKPTELVQVLQPFAKIPNAILPIDSSQILVLRDYTENVKRMLEMVKEVDVAVPSEFISEVIPIKYALASDIANALGSLGTGGSGTTVGSGSRAGGGLGGGLGGGFGASRFGSGFNRGGSYSGSYGSGTYPGNTMGSGFGYTPQSVSSQAVTPQAVQPGVGSSFNDRLQQIIKRASQGGAGDFQILGTNKIIADERTNSLLIFASRQDMATIKDIISKLDVVLAQVLIEAIIMEVSLDNSRNLGVNYLEGQAHGIGNYYNGRGAINNGGFLSPNSFSVLTNVTGGLSSGFSYLASFGQDLDVTLTAVANDSRVNVLSRPRIQTSHAVPANLFIGQTTPYIQGTTFGGFAGVGSQSLYQEKQVGITLSVLPLINPDGLVVMDISQDIEQLGTPVTIDGNPVPTTTKRSAEAKVAVKDRDTVMLGGFISTSKTSTHGGVPLLKDIPGLGYLFRSSADSSQRVELIVLIRPTVLPTPEAAAAVATAERNSLGGVRRAEQEIHEDEAKRLRDAEKASRHN